MTQMEWDDLLYSVRNDTIDHQHKNIITAINALSKAIEKRQTEHLCSKLHKALVTYAKEHFSYEERLLKKHEYPKLAAHKKMHQYFVQKVNEIYELYISPDTNLQVEMEMLIFLKEWFFNHILKIDKEFMYYIFVRETTQS